MANQALINLIKSGKARVLAIVAGVVIVGGAGGYWFYQERQAAALQSGAVFDRSPDLEALPGVGAPSQAYVKSVVYQNAKQSAIAAKIGKSNVPTLTRASFLGNPEDFLGADMQSHSCQKPHPNPQACSVSALMAARKSGVTADEEKCKGCECPVLKQVGYTAGDLKQAGFDAKGLKDCGFTAAQLRAAGFTAQELKDAGFTAKQLADAGFTPAQLLAAGFTPQQLLAAGFTPAQLAAAGIGSKQGNDCSPAAIKLAHDTGVSAQAMRAKGCGLAALKSGGYSADDLRNAGFSAKALANAGFSPNDLRAAGFSAQDLKEAGLTAGQLKEAGFDATHLAAAGFNPDDLRTAGFDADALHKAGFLPSQLEQAGFTKGDLIRAGYTPSQAGYVVPQAHDDGNAINQDMTAVNSGDMQSSNNGGMPSIASGTMQGRLEQIQKIQEQQAAAQQQQQALSQEEQNMAQQAQQFQKQWSNVAVQQYSEIKAPRNDAVNEAALASAAANTNAAALNGPVLKAGTIMFAVLDTGVNTDNVGSPIMASIVTGPLKGTKLMGQFTRVDKQVQLQFTLASVPGLPTSTSLSAVAIDQDTAQTALQGNVNNHYLLRYGSMFASAFVSGMADAMQSGGTTFYGPGIVWTSHSKLNTAQQVAAGIGNVGQQYAQSMSQNFNRAPTIKIPGGTGLGVLLMSDLQLPLGVKLNPGVLQADQQSSL